MSKERIVSDVNKRSATKAEQHNIPSESITSKETSLAAGKREKRSKSARFDFSAGVIYLSSDYRVINGPQIVTEQNSIDQGRQDDQTPTSKKDEVQYLEKVGQADSESAKPTITSGSGKPGLAGMKSARPTAEPGLADTKSAKLALHFAATEPGLAGMDLARPASSVLAGAEATLGDSALGVDCYLEMKNNVIQFKDMCFSNVINKDEANEDGASNPDIEDNQKKTSVHCLGMQAHTTVR